MERSASRMLEGDGAHLTSSQVPLMATEIHAKTPPTGSVAGARTSLRTSL
jgi:hypothetical protein